MKKSTLSVKGYSVQPGIYSKTEVDELLMEITKCGLTDQFGVRAVLADHPSIAQLVLNDRLRHLLSEFDLPNSHCIKSIYFDKPPASNWVVNWHQDLTVNLEQKVETPGYKNWRTLPERTVAQPPLNFLEGTLTVRIHLDDCTANNGALRIIPGSHLSGVIDIKRWRLDHSASEEVCEVPAGGVFLMRPLLLHSSKRTQNELPRRVLHLEFNGQDLPAGLKYQEEVSWA